MTRLALLSMLLCGHAFADADGGVRLPLEVHSRAVPSKAQLGEPFVVEVVITHDRDQRYELKAPGDLGDFEFLGVERARADGTDSSTTTFKVKLTAFQLGMLTTPRLEFEVAEPSSAFELPVEGTAVEIVSSLPADAKKTGANLYDVRPPEAVLVRTWRVLYALGGLLLAGLLAWALLRLFRRWKRVRAGAVKAPDPLHVRATHALDALAKENLPGQGRVREFYFRLSEIVRGYLGELYSFEALESTTPEVLDALRSRHTPGLPVQELSDFAHQSDFVRYARATPGPDECKVMLELGYRIVHATTAAALHPPAAPSSPTTPTASHGPQQLP